MVLCIKLPIVKSYLQYKQELEKESLHRCDIPNNHEIQNCADIVNPQSLLVNATDFENDADPVSYDET